MDCVKIPDEEKINITENIDDLDSPLDNDKLPKTKSVNNEDSQQDCDTKHKLKDYINEKKRKLDQSKRILELKYARYKYCNDFWNIGTIIISSLLTFTESTKLIFIDDNSPAFLKNIFDLTPIFFGTIITCSSSILKFKKYQEKMEELYIVIDKCIIMMGRLKIIREKIKLLDDCGPEFIKLKNEYVNDICKEYSLVYQETERYISNEDYDIYLKILNLSDYNKHMIDNDKTEFYKQYKHNIDMDDIKMNLKEKKEKCCI